MRWNVKRKCDHKVACPILVGTSPSGRLKSVAATPPLPGGRLDDSDDPSKNPWLNLDKPPLTAKCECFVRKINIVITETNGSVDYSAAVYLHFINE
jgi:hypothetical protein